MTIATPSLERCPLPRRRPTEDDTSPIRVGLLGAGQVGSAIAALARSQPAALRRPVTIAAALVRDPGARPHPPGFPLTTRAEDVFAAAPDVVVEVLGGVEPARTLVLDALARGIPVVTANKSLLAHHGDELQQAARDAGVPLRHEASVIAGVPFLDTLARRPLASSATAVTGILNGTSNYILSRMQADAIDYGEALVSAQRLGYAEPDPAKDVDGVDAAEKLTVLLRQLTGARLAPGSIATAGITDLQPADLQAARSLGGAVKPIAHARIDDNTIRAFVAPAFVPRQHGLAALHDAVNGLYLCDAAGREIGFTGPGAGPDVTAITVLDDVIEASRGGLAPGVERREIGITTPATAWFVRLSGRSGLPEGAQVADLLGSYGVWASRTSATTRQDGDARRWFLAYPCAEARLEAALAALSGAAGCATRWWRALESHS
jgi:homoserine dehydrogenase